MELREWAIRILSGDILEEKLFEPDVLTDHAPGSELFWDEPVRPAGMEFTKHTRKDKLPKPHDLQDSEKRAVCLHRFAGHELLAVEIMAHALLAFPNAPKHFRRGLANTLREEQEHVRLYIKRLSEMGVAFGDMPLYRHLWAYTPHIRSPETYVSVMSLTFEMANLDYAPLFGAAFAENGDKDSAKLKDRILTDEIAHVAFGWGWLKKLKTPGLSQWEAWKNALPELLDPKRAMGTPYREENRKMAGISDEWLSSFHTLIS